MFTIEETAVHHLLLKSHLLKEPGLFFGKMGVAIAFYDYGRKVDNEIFIEHGEDLIGGILNEIDHNINFDFGTGLAGIAWGIEYLIQNKYVEENSNSICSELDERIMSISFKRTSDLSLEVGIEGLLHYVLARIKGSIFQKEIIPFKKCFLEEIQSRLDYLNGTSIPEDLKYLIDEFSYFFSAKEIRSYNLGAQPFYIGNIDESKIGANSPLGLRRGLAGWLYNNT
jgi:hypothetical protein